MESPTKPTVVLITGASTGFGRRSAQTLARSGYKVYASMRDMEGKNAPHANQINQLAGQENLSIFPVEMDVTSDQSVEKALKQIIDKEGNIDVVINNAGIWGPGVLEAFSMEQWQEVFDVNVFGSVRVAKKVLPFMRKRNSGLIIQISSLQGRFILPYSGPYVSSKHAIEGAMETFCYEVAPFGVEVVIIEPGDFMTEMKEKASGYIAGEDNISREYTGVGEFIKNAYLTPDPSRSGDPMSVVEALQRVIEMPKGERPLRTTVGNFLPQIEQINSLSQQMHQALFPNIGLQRLLSVK